MPLLSEYLPIKGIRTDLEIENPAKIAPSHRPVAPRFFA
jgi:hypothetical protein